eukprot:5261268-Pyramimonas_sp.AAC.1
MAAARANAARTADHIGRAPRAAPTRCGAAPRITNHPCQLSGTMTGQGEDATDVRGCGDRACAASLGS